MTSTKINLPADSDAPDISHLIESSRPRPHLIGLMLPVMILLLISVPFLMSMARQSPGLGFLVLIPFAGLITISHWLKRFHRSIQNEQRNVESLEELVQLRRWPDAKSLATSILSKPMKSDAARVAALIPFSSVLIRYHQFESARMIHDAILSLREQLDPSLVHSITVARAMTLLREDRLVDADNALTELRRDVNRARDAARRAQAGAGKEIDDREIRAIDSAGLALLELYRDIKTGHFDEAIELFESRVKLIREQLAVRVSDAWALVARAYDARDRSNDAARAFHRATLLAPFAELVRRYPEIAPLAQRYQAAVLPGWNDASITT